MSSLAGKTFTITGQLNRYTRPDAVAKAALLGARFVTETSSKCDFVVRGDKILTRKEASNKISIAQKHGISIIPATEFYHYLATSAPSEDMTTEKKEVKTVSKPVAAMETSPKGKLKKTLKPRPDEPKGPQVQTNSIPDEHTKSNPISFKDKSVMVMPGLTQMSQIHAMFRLEQVGAFNVTTLDKAELVITNPTTGKSHLRTAEKKGVKIVSEEEFYTGVGFEVTSTAGLPSAPAQQVEMSATSPKVRISVGARRSKAKEVTKAKELPQADQTVKQQPVEKNRIHDGIKVAPTGPVTGKEVMFEMSAIPRSLEGKKIFFTGEFSTGLLGRTALAHKCGAMVTQHLTNDVDVVVCGSSPSQALLDQAAALEIPISDEADFNKKTVAFISEGILLNSLPQVSAEVEAQIEKSMITQAPEPATSPLNLDFEDGDWNVETQSPPPEI